MLTPKRKFGITAERDYDDEAFMERRQSYREARKEASAKFSATSLAGAIGKAHDALEAAEEAGRQGELDLLEQIEAVRDRAAGIDGQVGVLKQLISDNELAFEPVLAPLQEAHRKTLIQANGLAQDSAAERASDEAREAFVKAAGLRNKNFEALWDQIIGLRTEAAPRVILTAEQESETAGLRNSLVTYREQQAERLRPLALACDQAHEAAATFRAAMNDAIDKKFPDMVGVEGPADWRKRKGHLAREYANAQNTESKATHSKSAAAKIR